MHSLRFNSFNGVANNNSNIKPRNVSVQHPECIQVHDIGLHREEELVLLITLGNWNDLTLA